MPFPGLASLREAAPPGAGLSKVLKLSEDMGWDHLAAETRSTHGSGLAILKYSLNLYTDTPGLESLQHATHSIPIHLKSISMLHHCREYEEAPAFPGLQSMLTHSPCGKCGEPVDAPKRMALFKTWHPECLQCVKCERAIQDDTIVEFQGLLFHPHCRPTPTCEGCEQPIAEGGVRAIGANWHSECFRCAMCQAPLLDKEFCLQGRLPCHLDCRSACAACGGLVVDTILTAAGSSWHPRCFKCYCCGQLITTAYCLNAGFVFCCPKCSQTGTCTPSLRPNPPISSAELVAFL
eukprot:NODE_3199_length_1012_cov_67.338983_g3054_i0.p1 GENE.NODE_3199_length_1012_cov_67.338983_g3054_i0~~NODE_3199_length_1012_cov_67.338983_g3054_i0.p1  ORF type:complete len:313 (+),score=77.33 NODE_3199_length_1012_cov_67.338983_g3054_i0:66-941(+)